jgi:hypothetical protein
VGTSRCRRNRHGAQSYRSDARRHGAIRHNGTIAGEVKDATAGVLPGVTVEASSPALIEKVALSSRTGRDNTGSSSYGLVPTQ